MSFCAAARSERLGARRGSVQQIPYRDGPCGQKVSVLHLSNDDHITRCSRERSVFWTFSLNISHVFSDHNGRRSKMLQVKSCLAGMGGFVPIQCFFVALNATLCQQNSGQVFIASPVASDISPFRGM